MPLKQKLQFEKCRIPGMNFSDGTQKRRRESLYRYLRWKLEAKVIQSQAYAFQSKHRNQTALSKYFWGLKDQGLSPQIKWKIISHSSTANSFNGRCNLCLDEKISIINFKNQELLLNETNELVFKCRHRGKLKLSCLRATETPVPM